MGESERPIIVGAGPVGLATALFLTQKGIDVRLVEAREQASTESRALAVNPRSLSILEHTGVVSRMLQRGLPVRGAWFRGPRRQVEVDFSGMDSAYPYLLALSQAATEELLEEALVQAGGSVERGVRMVECHNVECHDRGQEAEVVLEHLDDRRERTRAPWLLSAEGAHSTARNELNIDFEGSTLGQNWHLADVPLRTKLAENRAHVFFLRDGALLFLLRVVGGHDPEAGGSAVWRVISNRPEPLSNLVEATPTGPALWTSRFTISHRVNATLSEGAVHFAGDAAHVHSPIGARGMNLGIEDAWVFAQLAAAQRLKDYDRLRRPVDRTVTRKVERLTRLASPDSAFANFVRSFLFMRVLKLPLARRQMIKAVAGLDHELPDPG